MSGISTSGFLEISGAESSLPRLLHLKYLYFQRRARKGGVGGSFHFPLPFIFLPSAFYFLLSLEYPREALP